MHLLAFADIVLFPDGTIFLHIAMILGMIWILNRTLFRPINRVLETRERNKGGNFSEASEIQGRVSEKESKYTSELLEARAAGYEMIEREQKAAAETRERQLAEVKTETATSLDKGREDVRKQSADAHVSIAAEAEKIADSIAATILKA